MTTHDAFCSGCARCSDDMRAILNDLINGRFASASARISAHTQKILRSAGSRIRALAGAVPAPPSVRATLLGKPAAPLSLEQRLRASRDAAPAPTSVPAPRAAASTPAPIGAAPSVSDAIRAATTKQVDAHKPEPPSASAPTSGEGAPAAPRLRDAIK